MLKILDYFARRKLLKSIDKINPYSDEFLEARLAELKERVDEKRYKHTLGVMKMAEKLCDTYGIDKKKAVLAAALHD